MKKQITITVLSVLFIMCTNKSKAQEWSEPVLITDQDTNNVDGSDKDMIVDKNGNVWVAWISGDTDIKLRYFDGTKWSETMTMLEDSNLISSPPMLAADNQNNIWVVYTKHMESGTDKIYSSYYNWEEWLEPMQVNADTGWAQYPSITVTPEGEIWVAYMYGPNTFGYWFEVAVKKWDENNNTWGSSTTISSEPDPMAMTRYNTAICPDGNGGIWTAWKDIAPHKVIKGSYYNGETWNEPVIISNETEEVESFTDAQLASGMDGKVWITYAYDNKIQLNYAIGSDWQPNVLTVSSDELDSEGSTITIDTNNRAWIAWEVPNNNQNYILSRFYKDNVFSDTLIVGINIDRAGQPKITSDFSGNIYSIFSGTDDSMVGLFVSYYETGNYIKTITTANIGIDIYPNPFKDLILINLNNIELKEQEPFILNIYSIIGKHIRKLYSTKQTTCWDGKDNNGNVVKPGIYYLKLSINEKQKPIVKPVIKLNN